MDIKELRIGNLVQLVGSNWNKKHRDTFVPLDLDDFVSIAQGSKHFGSIPLTEEWLLKLGFEKSDSGHIFTNGFTKWQFDGEEIKYIENYLTMYHREIEYVHDLQNLYYAITGTELIIEKPIEK